MNELQINNFNFQTEDQEVYIDSETVAKGFGIEHRSLIRSVENHFEKCDLKSHFIKNANNVNKLIYLLTERQIMILPAICKTTAQTIAFQTALVDAFIEARKMLSEPLSQTNLPQLAKQLAEMTFKLIADIEEKSKIIENQQKTIVENQPKVDFCDSLEQADGEITADQFAKLMNIRIQKFRDWFFQRFCYWQNKSRLPKECYREPIKYLSYKETEKDRKIYTTVTITAKGQAYILKKWKEHLLGNQQTLIEGE